jgi:hypothetical protein
MSCARRHVTVVASFTSTAVFLLLYISHLISLRLTPVHFVLDLQPLYELTFSPTFGSKLVTYTYIV